MNVKLIALSQTVLIRTVPGEACHQSHQMKSIYLTSQMKMETSRAMIIVTEVDAYTDPTSSSQLESHDHTTAVTLYKLCGDNIDKAVHQRYMRSDSHGTRSLHYFHSYAIADRSISPISLKKPSPQEV